MSTYVSPQSRDLIESLRNGQGEVREVAALLLRAPPWIRVVSTEESLHLDSPEDTLVSVPDNNAFEVDNSLSVVEHFNFPVRLTDIVEQDALRDGASLTRHELP